MILTVNIANSHISLGCVEGEEVLFLERIFSNPQKTDLEYSVDILNAFRLHEIDRDKVDGCIISCVVPQLLSVFSDAVLRLFSLKPCIVNAASQNLIRVRAQNPSEVGSNLIVTAVSAAARYGTPAIVIDMSTATTITVIDESRTLIGAAILPGMQTSMDALTGGAAQLTQTNIVKAVTPLGRTTEQSLNGGAIYGNAGMIDGILDRMEKELQSRPVIVATGRISRILIPYCRHEITIDEELTVRGLAILYGEMEKAKHSENAAEDPEGRRA